MSLEEQLRKGFDLHTKKQFDEAQAIFEQILKTDPTNDLALIYLCQIKIEKKEFSLAQKLLALMNDKTKKSKTYWKWLGQIEEGLGNSIEAISAYKKALTIDSKYSQVYYLLISLLDQKEDFVGACTYLFQAIRYLGLIVDFEQRLKKYQVYFAAQGGLQAPALITIKKNSGTLTLMSEKLEAIEEIKNLDVTKPILTNLNLSSNKIRKISCLEKLTEIRILNLIGNSIEKIEGLEQLRNLQSLLLTNNNISTIEGLDHLENLTTLNIANNDLTSLHGIENLSTLTILVVDNNKLKSLAGIESLVNLRQLYSKNNSLQDLKELSHLPKISYLHLSNNKLTSMDGLEKNSMIEELLLDNNNLKMVNNLQKMPNLKRLDLSGNKDLPSEIARDMDQSSLKVYGKEIDGLSSDALKAKITEMKQTQKLKVKQQMTKEQWEMEIKAIPGTITRSKYLELLERKTSDSCLYCGQAMPPKTNWTEYCRNQVNLLLTEANKKLPENLRSKIAMDVKEVDQSNKYEMVGSAGQQTWQKSGVTSGLMITDIRREGQLKQLFFASNYVTPKGTLCKRCADEFISKVIPIFQSVSSTKSKKSHDKMHETIKENYYKVFEAMILKALKN